MLAAQQYDNHTSIHDDATAQKLGFKGGTIEGPTHFSQFVPLCVAAWGARWLEQAACRRTTAIPASKANRCVPSSRSRSDGATQTTIWMLREDGTRDSARHGVRRYRQSADRARAAHRRARPPEQLVILRDVRVGMRTRAYPGAHGSDQHMGALYPFSLADKLQGHHGDLAVVLGDRRSARRGARRSFRSR